jgi:hypothetical protein
MLNKFFLLLLSINSITSEIGFKCFFYFDDIFAIYNIKNIILEKDEKRELEYTLKEDETQIKGKLLINICGSYKDIPEECGNRFKDSSIIFVSEDKKICKSLLSSDRKKNMYNILNDDFPLDGFKIHTDNSPLTVFLECNNEKKVPEFIINENNNLIVNSSDACATKNQIAEFVYKNKYIFCAIVFLLGLIFLTVGGYKWDLIVSLVGFLFGFLSIFFILFVFIKFENSTKSYLIITAIAIIVGIIVACFCHSFNILSYLLLGFMVGYFITKYVLMMMKTQMKDYQIILLNCGTGLVVGCLCALTKQYMVAIMTAILGSFLMVYSLGYIFGILGNFFDLIERIRAGGDLSVSDYVFFAFFILIAIVGVVIQFRFIIAERNKQKSLKMEKLIIE